MKPKKTNKYQRIKLAALPLLCCLLGYVLLSPAQPDDESTATQLANPQPSPTLSSPARAPATPASTLHWPEVDLQFLSQANPLASQSPVTTSNRAEHFVSTSTGGGTPPLPESDPLQNLARDLSGSQVNYVFKSSRRQAVMLGDQMFEQGELLSDTVQLHDIQDHALILMESDNDPLSSRSARAITELMAKFSQLLLNNAATPSPVGATSYQPVSGQPVIPSVID